MCPKTPSFSEKTPFSSPGAPFSLLSTETIVEFKISPLSMERTFPDSASVMP